MLKISFAGCLGLCPAISAHFANRCPLYYIRLSKHRAADHRRSISSGYRNSLS